MLNPLKINEKLDKVFVVSDLHFNHDRDFIWGARGFSSCQEHGEKLVEEWNARVSNEDVVFHLGDLIFNDKEGTEIKKLLNRLNFKTIYLAQGNHGSGYKQYYKESLGQNNIEIFPLWTIAEDGREICFIPNYFEIIVEKKFFACAHYPIISHNGQAQGSYHLCGHSHGNCAITNKDTGQGRRLDVGIDSFGGPISLKFAVDFLKERDYNCLDHPR